MVRGLIVGSLAFVAAFALERLLASMKDDLARYDSLRKMSGEEPLGKELLSTAGSLITGSMRDNGVTSFVASLSNDIVRYAKIRGM